MAKQVITLLTDDLDGTEAAETIAFAFDGSNYTIDLNDEHAKELRALMQRFADAGLRTGRHVPLSGGSGYTPGSTLRTRNKQFSRDENADIRKWAAKNGYELADRGRIPQHIINAHRNGIPAPAPAATPEPAPEAVAEPAAPAAKRRTSRKPTPVS